MISIEASSTQSGVTLAIQSTKPGPTFAPGGSIESNPGCELDKQCKSTKPFFGSAGHPMFPITTAAAVKNLGSMQSHRYWRLLTSQIRRERSTMSETSS
jgi:hypothetical protein